MSKYEDRRHKNVVDGEHIVKHRNIKISGGMERKKNKQTNKNNKIKRNIEGKEIIG